MSDLLRTTPAAELGDRLPGREISTIGDAALPSPDTLLVIVGHAPDELAATRGTVQVASVLATVPDDWSS